MLYEWYNEIFSVTSGSGTAENFRRTLTLTQYNALNQPGRIWSISEAWPKKYKPFSDLNGTSSDNSIEEVVICHEGIQLIFGI
jgi:phage tail-like protein